MTHKQSKISKVARRALISSLAMAMAVAVFLSGLLVGLFAAPCVGPTIVALLAVVAQSGNPWFGFLAFFVLSIGLGLPYLVLGTYTGLLQRLPRFEIVGEAREHARELSRLATHRHEPAIQW